MGGEESTGEARGGEGRRGEGRGGEGRGGEDRRGERGGEAGRREDGSQDLLLRGGMELFQWNFFSKRPPWQYPLEDRTFLGEARLDPGATGEAKVEAEVRYLADHGEDAATAFLVPRHQEGEGFPEEGIR